MSEMVVRDTPEPLSEREEKLLIQFEADIEQNLKGFKKVGYALTVIRDQELYRIDYDTFEEYCREVWDLGRPRAYQLMGGYAVVDNLSTIVDKGDSAAFDILPVTESQARPLASLSPEQQVEVWQAVINMAQEEGCKITAELVLRCLMAIRHKKVSDSIGKVKKYGERHEKILPEDILQAVQTVIDMVQLNTDANWQEIGKKEMASLLREILQALEA